MLKTASESGAGGSHVKRGCRILSRFFTGNSATLLLTRAIRGRHSNNSETSSQVRTAAVWRFTFLPARCSWTASGVDCLVEKGFAPPLNNSTLTCIHLVSAIRVLLSISAASGSARAPESSTPHTSIRATASTQGGGVSRRALAWRLRYKRRLRRYHRVGQLRTAAQQD